MSETPTGSMRSRGEPPNRASGVQKPILALAAAALISFVGGVVIGGGGDGGGSTEAGKKAEPTQQELARAEEKRRKKAARKGEAGKFVPAPGRNNVYGGDAGELTTYSVAVEEATGVRPRDFAALVDSALGDPRSWIGGGGVRVQRVEDGKAAVRIVLGTPDTVDELCLPLDTMGQFSCREGGQLNINLERWLNGTDAWPLSQDAYRNHVINHEFGHFLGFDHLTCPGNGQQAPVMMQQTKDLGGCKANAWPYPEKGKG